MSEQTNEQKDSSAAPPPETQSQRWVKYGSNVVLVVVVAVVLGGLLTYIAEARNWRLDTTAQGINSLRPQTLAVLHNLGSDIKLISLYSKAEESDDTSASGAHPIDRSAFVSDLLDNYKRNSSHITVDAIDPTDKAKIDALVSDLDTRYGKDIKNYKEYLAGYEKDTYKTLNKLIADQQAKLGTGINDDADKVGAEIRDTMGTFSRLLDDNKKQMDRALQSRRPDYHGLTTSLRDVLDKISKTEEKIPPFFAQNKTSPDASETTRKYMAESLDANAQIKKIADDQIAQIDKLGELKVDDLQRALNVADPILVLGPDDWRVLSRDQVWPEAKAIKQIAEGKAQPNFAGEQQVTTAILSLTSKNKPKVVFLRPGGGPLTNPGFPPFQEGGPFSEFAGRLRDYNFEILEKDISGQSAMNPENRDTPPDPSWDDINDAVWIVVDAGAAQGGEPLGPRLAAHLGHGGSAIVMAFPQGDALDTPLHDWGITLHPDLIAVHQQIPVSGNASSGDFVQQALRQSFIWDLKEYGDAELTRPLKNLESLWVYLTPVTSHDVSGYKVTSLLPLPDAPNAPKSWGEKDLSSIQEGTPPKFQPDKGDIAGPLFGGAAVEKTGGGRLVVFGTGMFVTNQFLLIPDLEVARNEGRFVARFPGNGELATNSVFWCAKMDSMIALSPAALQVSRIDNMGSFTLLFWRFVVIAGLSCLVIVGGLGMYVHRRD